MKFQVAHIDGKNPKIKDKKIHNFSMTRLGKKRKLDMSQTVETVIVRAQQNFSVVGGLNPVQIEIEDDRIINILRIYKNLINKVTPLGLLFPASPKMIQNKYLSPGKKSILNAKNYDLVAIIDLHKINNRKEIKGPSIWINVSFKDKKEINNNSHLCFPFVARSLNDLKSFSIYLQDDKKKRRRI